MNSQIEIKQVETMENQTLSFLSDLLIKVVNDGASIGFLPPLQQDAAVDYWKEVINPGVILWSAVCDGIIAGTIQLHLVLKQNGSHRAEVAKLMVDPAYRRKGIAQMLMQTAEEFARSEGRSLLVLDTRTGDPSNILYKSRGYIEVGQIPNYALSVNGQMDGTTIYYKQLF
ncbi:GNAT family N-acetyltransferase [Paenibacillus sp. GP183]|uniref:GNAT family N-acetyltransferase n=1 Tax=Paenibacillus sp. GP183 TaxID=1882751 RepID=UPI00089637AC|nr:GNAT family N-acetyltransferase [Paenibacillus sp. GP183]SEB61725.1 Acetyltransferase (GNAT) family protein [Paenibacillus sp. GP183]